MEVIPAIDLRAGQVVNLRQGDYARETVYGENPAATAAEFAAAGVTRIHVVDLDAARDGSRGNHDAIAAILAAAEAAGGVPVQVGGGVRSLERAEELLGMGVDRVIVGTAALEKPELIPEICRFKPHSVVLGLDARHGKIATRGWLETSEITTVELLERFADVQLGAVLHTDIERDGMLEGPNVASTADLARRTEVPVIASGGVSRTEDLIELAQTRVIAGCIVGRAIYTGALDLRDAIERVAAC